ncbi:hypothetical protein LTR62_006321 [Meristemomyces frigidus]|uniref:Transcription factor domain-containing protein n=1 Tax=Meristemomyces frigidus TaxID=1508187 RepID=A0AAN7TC94_9PEZI|nr:hypothetical protein LTR62_006321 [Meristemomyces frigidus]
MANIAGYWAVGDSKRSVFSSQASALGTSHYWLRCGLDVLEDIWRNTGPDLGTIQSKIIFMFCIFHMDVLSLKGRNLLSSAITDARNIGLHMTDASRSTVRETTQAEIIDAELRRRVCWHLVSTDWSAALLVGPCNGVYTVHPNHLHVRKPRNIMEEDLSTKPADFERPEDELTSTTYYLSRITLANICREVADTLLEMETVPDLSSLSYDRILALDKKFVDLIEGLPGAFRLESDVDTFRHDEANLATSSVILKQKYFTYLTTEARRCKLHLPYLLRSQQSAKYNFSRETCLQAARKILRLQRVLPSEVLDMSCSIKMICLLHHFYSAIIILVMDLCVNRQAGQDDRARKTEIISACKIVEGAKETSTAASHFLESVGTILRKHKVRLYDEEEPQAIGNVCYEPESRPAADDTTANHVPQLSVELSPPQLCMGNGHDQHHTGYDMGMDIDFDAMWQSYLQFDSGLKWDSSLLTGLDGADFVG